jgi:hypothetical protein
MAWKANISGTPVPDSQHSLDERAPKRSALSRPFLISSSIGYEPNATRAALGNALAVTAS